MNSRALQRREGVPGVSDKSMVGKLSQMKNPWEFEERKPFLQASDIGVGNSSYSPWEDTRLEQMGIYR